MKKLKEYLNDDLLDNESFLKCAEHDLHRMSAAEISRYVLEAARLKFRLEDIREKLLVIDWWLDNGEDITIRDVGDTLSYLEETLYFGD